MPKFTSKPGLRGPAYFLALLIVASSAASAQQTFHTSHVILRVSNLDRSIAFFKERVGLPLQSSNEELALFNAGAVTLMIEQLPTRPSSSNGGLTALTEIVLQVPDVRRAYAEMTARGVTFRVEPRTVTSDGTRDLYAADFRDPDGHALSIAGWIDR